MKVPTMHFTELHHLVYDRAIYRYDIHFLLGLKHGAHKYANTDDNAVPQQTKPAGAPGGHVHCALLRAGGEMINTNPQEVM